MHFIPIQGFFSQKYGHNKKERNFRQQDLQIAAFQQFFFQMMVERPYFGGVINPKNYLNRELGASFFPE